MAPTPQNTFADPMKKLLITLALLPGLSLAGEPATTYTCDDGSKMAVTISADPDGRPLATLNIS